MFQQLRRNAFRAEWNLATAQPVGEAAIAPPSLAMASAQFSGTFGGATAVLEASNDGLNWILVRDKDGVAVSTASPAVFELSNSQLFVRALLNGGTGSLVKVTVIAWSGL